ncbi:MAG TPA: pilus assembly PilX N-terminal domain-containing protein [Candidatus Paceibacterota bacterium]|nr:pilus assembly PilX N-terminal domain-containing protein [Candidatus Paceibacterota bacterium]
MESFIGWNRSFGSIQNNQGFTLLFGILIGGFMLAIGTSVLGFAARQTGVSGLGRESQSAFYAADSGMECAKYFDIKNNAFLSSSGSIQCGGYTINFSDPGDTQCPNATLETCEVRNLAVNVSTGQTDPSAEVVIYKSQQSGRTTIKSSGHNTRDLTRLLRVERTVEVAYTPDSYSACEGVNPPPDVTGIPNEQLITINAYGIRCDDEGDLPDWMNAETENNEEIISPEMVTEFLATNPSCRLETRCFEWGYTGDVYIPHRTRLGSAGEPDPVSGWNSGSWYQFSRPSTVSRPATIKIEPLDPLQEIWVRYVLTEEDFDFLEPFTQNEVRTDGQSNPYCTDGDPNTSCSYRLGNPEPSAEMICHKDQENYDNYDAVRQAVAGGTYTCVGFSAPKN